MADNKFKIKIGNWQQGMSPAAHLDTETEIGNAGHASEMTEVDILTPGYITQGPGMATLTGATGTTGSGGLRENINYILETPPASDTTYGIGNTKLYQISSTELLATGNFPYSPTGCTSGKSIAYLKGTLYYLFHAGTGATGGHIGAYDLSSAFSNSWQTGLNTATLMPVATKEDIMLFGHGRYVGTYFSSTSTINKTKLDFGTNNEVADICFHANQWFIAVNTGVSGTNRNLSQIYTYAGGATTTILSDEASVGLQKIGFLYPLNGVVYVAYQDLSFTGGYRIGYISGRKIEPLVSFTGSLPTYAQKTLYKNTILFLSNGKVKSAGAVIPEYPFAISDLADGGYDTCGALAAPFGTPMVSSTDGTHFQLAKFSGYSKSSSWKSTTIPIVQDTGYIDYMDVRTDALATGASCDVVIKYNQGETASSTNAIGVSGTMSDRFNLSQNNVDDLKVELSWANGSTSNPCKIKDITIYGHYVQRA